jgi:hypothetical protein
MPKKFSKKNYGRKVPAHAPELIIGQPYMLKSAVITMLVS